MHVVSRRLRVGELFFQGQRNGASQRVGSLTRLDMTGHYEEKFWEAHTSDMKGTRLSSAQRAEMVVHPSSLAA